MTTISPIKKEHAIRKYFISRELKVEEYPYLVVKIVDISFYYDVEIFDDADVKVEITDNRIDFSPIDFGRLTVFIKKEMNKTLHTYFKCFLDTIEVIFT